MPVARTYIGLFERTAYETVTETGHNGLYVVFVLALYRRTRIVGLTEQGFVEELVAHPSVALYKPYGGETDGKTGSASAGNDGGRNGVEDDGGRIAALFVLDDAHFCAICPNGKLIARRRAEGIRRGNGNALFLPHEIIRHLADGRRFPHAVYPYEHDNAGIGDLRNFRLVQRVF